MKEWFAQLNQREQMSLLALGLALALYLLYMFVWSPLDEQREQLALQNAAIAESQVRVDAMVSELLQLRKSGVKTGTRRNLTSVINESTGRWQLPVIRLQPNSRGEIQVRLENAAFDDVLQWLYQMEYTEHMLVREVSLTQANTAGLVNVTARIAEAG
ncbi:Type II secretion system protein M [Halioglobus japonicus]|nr:Type II secretion system protein M [Halioglobus japonicus]